jgi:hypothetical protein
MESINKLDFGDDKKIINQNVSLNEFKKGEMLKNLDKLSAVINDINKFKGSESLTQNIKKYKTILSEVNELAKDYISRETELKSKTIKLDLFDEKKSNKFNTFINQYNTKINEKIWTKEMFTEQEDIFIDNLNSIENFNSQLTELFSPFINSTGKNLNDNLSDENIKLNQLIEIAREFVKYIKRKKNDIDLLVKSNYDQKSLHIISITENNIKPESYVEELKEIKISEDSKLDIKEIQKLQNLIKGLINGIDIKSEMNELNKFDIIISGSDLTNILNIDDALNFKKPTTEISMKGGSFIVNNETNKELLIMMDKLQKLYEIIDNVMTDSQYLKQLHVRYNYYIVYLIHIVLQSTQQNQQNQQIFVFKYISEKIIKKYLEILYKIMKKFTSIKKEDKFTQYLNKYHYISIDKIIKLFEYILPNLDSDKVVYVYECKKDISNDLNLFNNFKDILRKYIQTDEGKTVCDITNLEETLNELRL